MTVSDGSCHNSGKKFPDKDVVRVALTDAVKGNYGALVEGRAGAEAKGKGTDGWMLTPAGSTWVRENAARIEHALGVSKSDVSKSVVDRFRKQIAAQPLFQKFLKTGGLWGESPYALTDMLNTSPDAPREVILTKFSPPSFPGQDTPLFRVLIAEIVAESVCHKASTMEAKQRPWDFRWADLKEDYLIADDVRTSMQKRLRNFLAEAHSIMLGDQEISSLGAD